MARDWFLSEDAWRARQQAMVARLGETFPEVAPAAGGVSPVDCPPGWSGLLAELLARARLSLDAGQQRRFRWTALGSCQGVLSARCEGATDHVVDLIEEMVSRSARTCAVCGSNGRVQHIFDRVSTLCPGHRVAEILGSGRPGVEGPGWLNLPHPDLDNVPPRRLMETNAGCRRVLEVLLEGLADAEPIELAPPARAAVDLAVHTLRARLGSQARDARLLRGVGARPEVGVVIALWGDVTTRAWMDVSGALADRVALSPITPQEWGDPVNSYRPLMLIRARRWEPSLLHPPATGRDSAPEALDLLLDSAAERELISAIDRLGANLERH